MQIYEGTCSVWTKTDFDTFCCCEVPTFRLREHGDRCFGLFSLRGKFVGLKL